MDAASADVTQDEYHLKLLSIFHYVLGGLTVLLGFCPIFHLALGLFFMLAPEEQFEGGEAPPPVFGWVFVLFPAAMMLAGWILAGLILTAGRFIATRRNHTFCVVVAGLECLLFPIGTILGVFSIVVLSKASIRSLFAGRVEMARIET